MKRKEEKVTAKEIILCIIVSLILFLLFIVAVQYHNTKNGGYIENPDPATEIHYIYSE